MLSAAQSQPAAHRSLPVPEREAQLPWHMPREGCYAPRIPCVTWQRLRSLSGVHLPISERGMLALPCTAALSR